MSIHMTEQNGVEQPECSQCRNRIFSRDVHCDHTIDQEQHHRLQIRENNLSMQLVGNGLSSGDYICSHCLALSHS